MAKTKGLGKGLDSLIPAGKLSGVNGAVSIPEAGQEKKDDENPSLVPITKIEPNRDQPRKEFKKEALEELADSIRQYGLIEPIVVQKKKDRYEIIAGERRWRAAMSAGLKEVPVVIRSFTRQEILEISLIENLQREDLNPIEEALAYKKLMTEFDLTQEEVAGKVSKSRTAVTNSMRLLKLPESIQKMIIEGAISSGHARALLSLEDEKAQESIAEKIKKDNLTVRDVEKLVRDYGKEKEEKPKKPEIDEKLLTVYREIEESLKQTMNTKVKIVPSATVPQGGKLEIEFYTSDDLENIVDGIRKGLS